MKKVLIISFHSLPFDTIASYRAMAYVKHFGKFGIHPTLVTHNWDKSDIKDFSETEKNEHNTIVRIPIMQGIKNRWLYLLKKNALFNRIFIVSHWLSGYLEPNPMSIFSYYSFQEKCTEILSHEKYDVIIGIFSPHHHLKLCYDLHKKFKVPYILDFRDLWDNRIIHKKYAPNFTELAQDRITKYYWKKWLSKASFFSTVSTNIKDYISAITPIIGKTISNGFDPELFAQSSLKSETKQFIIIHGGTLYSHQKIEIFLKGCQLFVEKLKPENFSIKFIGAIRGGALPGQLSGYLYNPEKIIRNYLTEEFCSVTKRISKNELASEISICQLLLFPGLPDSPGTPLGKIYDYLASRKNILMVPDDNSVVGELIRETKTGYICNTVDEVYQMLNSLYKKWQKNGNLTYKGDQEKINKYSRESQVKKMAEYIHEYL